MIQVYKKNELFIIENTINDIIYPNLTREEAIVLLKKFNRDEPEDRCDFAIKEESINFKYASLDNTNVITPEFKIDENVIIIDFVDDEPIYIDDFVIQIIISKDNVEYLFEKVSRPVSIHSKRLFKYSSKKEQELLNNGYRKVYNLI